MRIMWLSTGKRCCPFFLMWFCEKVCEKEKITIEWATPTFATVAGFRTFGIKREFGANPKLSP